MLFRILGLLSCCVAVALAQSTQATIRGVVTDAQGAVVGNAEVTAADAGTGVVTKVKSNQDGIYSLPNLATGSYNLTVRHDGFRTYQRQALTLTTGEVLGIDVSLEVGAVTESVTVTGVAALVSSRSSDVNQLIESRSVEDLPLGNRQALNIIKLTGAAVYVSDGTSATATPNFSVAGGRSESQMYYIDGGTAQNMRLGVAEIDEDPPVETVDEIKVLSNNYAAEYGGSASGVIIMTTKSGTNQFHGATYEYFRNDVLDAPGFFAPIQNGAKTSPELRYNLFGGVLGGPVRHDKTFFFVGMEGALRGDGSVTTLTVPTALQDAGNFSQTLNAKGQVIPIYDPSTTTGSGASATRSAFPGNAIPASQLDPVALNILKYYPLPNRPPDNITGANDFRANTILDTTHYNITLKGDHNFSDRDRLTVRYLYNHDDTSNATVYPVKGADPTATALDTQGFWYGAWTHILSPTKVNDFRFTYEGRVNHAYSDGIGGNYPEKLGLQGVSENAFPQIVVAGFSTLGSSAQERRQYPIQTYQWVDNLSWTHGKHALKFGAEVRKSRNHEINLSTASGAFNFATTGSGLPGNAATGSGMASMLLGFINTFSESSTEVIDRSSYYLAGFAQDDFTVSESLVLNIGLRWETDTPIRDAYNRMNGFNPTAINPVSGTPGVVTFMGVNGLSSDPYSNDWNSFGPRFGLAWKPFHSDRTVVRGGFGIFYAHPFDSGQPASANLGFSVNASLSTPDNGLTAPFLLRNGVPVQAVAPALNSSFGAVAVGQTTNTAVTYFDPAHRDGYSQQFNLAVQHELRGNIVVEVSGIGNLSRKLAGGNLPLDQILPQTLGPNSDTQVYRPFPQFTNVTMLSPALGVSSYFGGMLKVEKRFSHGVSMLATYTYSKYLEDTDGGGAVLGANGGYSNLYNRAADWGPSGNDIRHRITFSEVYELPFGTGRRWFSQNPLRYALGGWSIGNVSDIQTGAPFTVTTQTNTTNSFSAGSLRANVLRNPNLGSGQRSVAEWFDTSAFAQPATFQFGSEGPGALRAAGLVNFDFSLLRDFRLGDRFGLQFRGEFLNTFNHTNLGLPGATFGASGFGVITSSGSPRVIQVGARIKF